MKSLPVIQSLWIGDKLSTMERLCISSFLHHGHPFHLYTYDHVENVPEGTILKDANQIFPRELISKCKYGSYAAFSDIFRYKLLFEKGNYWVDTDIICLQPFDDNKDYVFTSERLEHPTVDVNTHITNCVIKVPAGTDIMKYCYEKSLEKDIHEIEWGEIGPKLIQEAIHKFHMNSFVAKPQVFCPIDYWSWDQLINVPVNKSIFTNSKAIHLWNEMWRQNEVDKDGTFNESSIYESLKNVYLKTPKYHEDEPLMVSVCVMSYNLEDYIEEALDSILIQKVNFKYNIIVGDDYSTDNTRQILQDYANRYPDKFTLILHEENIGILANFVSTLKACHGKYIALLDGDDYWTDPLKLQKQVDFLERNKDFSMVFHNIELHDHTYEGVIVRPFNLEKNSREYTYDEIVRTWSAGTCSVLCINNKQYQYIEKNLWFPVQDLPFYLCCASMGKLYYMSDSMSVYRQLLTGSQKSKKFRTLEHHLNFINYLKTLYSDFSNIISQKSIGHEYARHYHAAAYKCQWNGNIEDYWKYLTLAMKHDPEFIYEKEISNHKKTIETKNKLIEQQKTILKQQSKINKLVNNRWYRFGQMSKKRKIWTIGKVVSKKIKLYWLLQPMAKTIKKILVK